MRELTARLGTSLMVMAAASIAGLATVFVLASMFGTPAGTGVLSPAPATSPSLMAGASAAPAPTTVAATATAQLTESPSPALSLSPQATAAPTPIVHVVAPGESLSLIAERYGVTVVELVELNDIEDLNVIFPDQRLLIPVADD